MVKPKKIKSRANGTKDLAPRGGAKQQPPADVAASLPREEHDPESVDAALRDMIGDAIRGNPVATIFEKLSDGRVHPHPARWGISNKAAGLAYLFSSPALPDQARRMLRETDESVEDRAGKGIVVLQDTLDVLQWMRLIERIETDGRVGYRMSTLGRTVAAEMEARAGEWLDTANVIG